MLFYNVILLLGVKHNSNCSRIASRVMDIPLSGIREFFEIVQTTQGVISLGIGEPDFSTPWHICEAAIFSIEKGKTSYTSNLGNMNLRVAISDYVHQYFGVSYDPKKEIIVTVGVSEAIDLALRAMVNMGDTVLYHEPSYVSYNPSIYLAGGIPLPVSTESEDAFHLKIEKLEKKVTDHTRFLLMNFPTNPTGAVMSSAELEKIAFFSQKHNLIVISDEIYSELVYDNFPYHSIVNFPRMKDRTILLHGFSKAFAMTGWRIGFACGPADIIEAMMKIHQYSILCVPIMAQEAAIEALKNGTSSVIKMRQEYLARRNFMLAKIHSYGLLCNKPEGAFYLFPNIQQTGLSSKAFALKLLSEQKVAVVPGSVFGASGEGHIRCSYATSLEKITIAMERLGDFLNKI